MKVIISRKGFDSSNGGCPSPILPDGTMLSFPIPSDEIPLTDLMYAGKTYLDIWKELKPRKRSYSAGCHLDPDIRINNRVLPADWEAIFGQISGSETHLENNNVGIGDLFLFFGWFQLTELNEGKYKYLKGADFHAIYGYLQIGAIERGINCKKYNWHPHGSYDGNNTIYIASNKLMFDGIKTDLPGFGVLKFSDDLVLTKKGLSRSKWELPDFFKTLKISHHSEDSFRDGYFQSANIGQEFVIEENKEVSSWAKGLILNNYDYRNIEV